MSHPTTQHTGRGAIAAGIAAAFLLLPLAVPARAADGDRPILPAAESAPTAPTSRPIGGTPIAAPSGSMTGDAVRTVVALGAVLALALVLRQVARRFADPLAARRPSGVVQVLSRFPVGKGQSIQLLAVGTRVLCVHQGAGAMSTLCEITDPQEIALLRTRIEAGTPGRDRFEGELVRSLERDESLLRQRRGAAAAVPTPTETIDLTQRRPQARRQGLALAGGGRG